MWEGLSATLKMTDTPFHIQGKGNWYNNIYCEPDQWIYHDVFIPVVNTTQPCIAMVIELISVVQSQIYIRKVLSGFVEQSF